MNERNHCTQKGRRGVVLNHLTRFLHQFPVRHTGRASRFASTAVQASGDVLDEAFGNRHHAALLGAHQVNPASRRISFAAQLDVRGTSLQAKAAVDALGREVGPAG